MVQLRHQFAWVEPLFRLVGFGGGLLEDAQLVSVFPLEITSLFPCALQSPFVSCFIEYLSVFLFEGFPIDQIESVALVCIGYVDITMGDVIILF